MHTSPCVMNTVVLFKYIYTYVTIAYSVCVCVCINFIGVGVCLLKVKGGWIVRRPLLPVFPPLISRHIPPSLLFNPLYIQLSHTLSSTHNIRSVHLLLLLLVLVFNSTLFFFNHQILDPLILKSSVISDLS